MAIRTLGFHYKCPLCGEIDWYDMGLDNFTHAAENPNEIVICRCRKCNRTWVKYASVVFGGDDKS